MNCSCISQNHTNDNCTSRRLRQPDARHGDRHLRQNIFSAFLCGKNTENKEKEKEPEKSSSSMIKDIILSAVSALFVALSLPSFSVCVLLFCILLSRNGYRFRRYGSRLGLFYEMSCKDFIKSRHT